MVSALLGAVAAPLIGGAVSSIFGGSKSSGGSISGRRPMNTPRSLVLARVRGDAVTVQRSSSSRSMMFWSFSSQSRMRNQRKLQIQHLGEQMQQEILAILRLPLQHNDNKTLLLITKITGIIYSLVFKQEELDPLQLDYNYRTSFRATIYSIKMKDLVMI